MWVLAFFFGGKEGGIFAPARGENWFWGGNCHRTSLAPKGAISKERCLGQTLPTTKAGPGHPASGGADPVGDGSDGEEECAPKDAWFCWCWVAQLTSESVGE